MDDLQDNHDYMYEKHGVCHTFRQSIKVSRDFRIRDQFYNHPSLENVRYWIFDVTIVDHIDEDAAFAFGYIDRGGAVYVEGLHIFFITQNPDHASKFQAYCDLMKDSNWVFHTCASIDEARSLIRILGLDS